MDLNQDLASLSRILATTERRAAQLERENEALRMEIKEIDPSGSAEHRAQLRIQHTDSEPDGTPPLISPFIASKTISAARILTAKREASSKIAKQAAAKAKQKVMVSLQAGDLIWLRQKDDSHRGTVLGDCSMKTVGVQPDESGTGQYVPPLRFGDGVFRLCSHFNYRSKVEVSKILKTSLQSGDPEATQRELNLPLAKKRMASEAVQNAELLERLIRSSPSDPKEPIRYGEVVQLQHVNSGLFLAVHKTPAPMNPSCRKVSLKAGSLAAHFKILPKYKVRSIGSLVYSDDEIVLQSVKHEGLYLGASEPAPSLDESNPGGGLSRQHSRVGAPVFSCPDLKLRLPSVLKHEATSEVNGAMELRSFTIKIYRRAERQGSLLTGLHWFRLFHPEANGFVQASANPDKGKVLDALDTPDDPLEASRVGSVPAHVPYLKSLPSTADASNPINLSAKAVWCFEPVDRTSSVEVKWRNMPLRIRHVPSGKYLSVDSKKATALTPRSSSVEGGAGGGGGGGVGLLGGSVSERDMAATAEFFDVALVDDEDSSVEEGAFGSPSSLVFYLMPTDVTGPTLREGTSAIRVEHRCKEGGAGSGAVGGGRERVLHLVSMYETKPQMIAGMGGSGTAVRSRAVRKTGSMKEGKSFGAMSEKESGVRLCFTSEFSALHVLKVQPLAAPEKFKLNKLLSYLPLFKKYSYAYHEGAAPRGHGPPQHLCVSVASQCLNVIDDLRKGVPPPRRHGTNMTEAMKEANAVKPAAFSLFFAGEPEPRMQKMAYEVKLLDAMFEAALAPYNYAQQLSSLQHAPGDGRPFSSFPGSFLPPAVQKFVYVAIQRVVFGNLAAQNYFSMRSSRSWTRPKQANEPLSPSSASKAGRGSKALMSVSSVEEDEEGEGEDYFPGATADVTPVRKWELWRNIIVDQGEDSLGATVTLGQLLKSSEKIVKKLVNNELMERFQNLLVHVGPEVRLINLFASICYVEKRPSRANQEMCVRKLWMNPSDRYAFGVTLHEVQAAPGVLPHLGPILQPDGSKSPWPRVRAPSNAPKAYLGRVEENTYKQVCVAWTGTDDWSGGCGHLWVSPRAMGVGPVVETRKVEGVDHPVQLVPLEQLMWVIEPNRLCKACTGKMFIPFVKRSNHLNRRGQSRLSAKAQSGDLTESMRRKRFENQLQLATFVIAQMELLTQMCKGRSYNCIAWLEKSFSFGLLMNIATNPHLPYKLIATAMDFLQALYVDRFPQFKNSGAPVLPEKLWVCHEAETLFQGPQRSTTPVIQRVDLAHPAAFPVFNLSPLCSAFGHPDPVMSHPDHFKFFLLRSHCNGIIKSFGKAGRIVHSSQSLNEFGMAAIRGQQNLLKFGFQSTHAKLMDLCVPNGALLDGRSDLCTDEKVFDPPTARYRDEGSLSQVVTKLKKEVIDMFFDIGDLRTNFRLRQTLNSFKEKAEAWAREEESGGASASVDSRAFTAKEYLQGSTSAAIEALYADFEAMFPGGSGDGAKLDLAKLASKPDLDQALIDCMMYDDDNLMSAALRLLESNYGQRRMLRTALSEVTLLEHIRIPVYGDVHALRADLSELVFLARTSSVWGVKSRISGPFGDEQFGTIMHIIDKVLTFMHTPYEQDRVLIGPHGDASSYCGSFAETDLQGNSYELTKVWSLDVANKWSPSKKSSKIDTKNQDILRSSNLQEILLESVMIDTAIAWKGSICTDREKAESERRLTMVKRALLVCCTVFASDNRKNQDIMFKRLDKLEELATPRRLVEETEEDAHLADSKKNPSRARRSADQGTLRDAQNVSSSAQEGMAWPTSVTELAQNVIITILRGNAALCACVSPTLVSLFSHIANLNADVSSSPVLELLFILCKPEAAPVSQIQSLVCNNLTAFERGQGLENLFHSLRACLKQCATKSAPIPDLAAGEDLVFDTVTAIVDVEKSAGTLVSGATEAENPEKLVRLMRVVCEGGNESAAAQLKLSCEISIDAVCKAIVSHIEVSLGRAVHEKNSGALASVESGGHTPSGSELSPQAVLHLMSEPDSVGKSLLELLVELVFLLPLNHEQIMSAPLWQFLQNCAAPIMESLGQCRHMSKSVLEVCTDIVDLLEHVFIFVVRLGLFRAVTENPSREQVISSVADDVQAVLDRKQKKPEFLKQAFIDYCDENKVANLNKTQFIGLSLKLMRANEEKKPAVSLSSLTITPTKKPPPLRRKSTNTQIQELSREEKEELERAFDDADLDENGEVDMYEFVVRFSAASVGRKVCESGAGGGVRSSSLLQATQGHRLSLRTVECAERIVLIRKGKGRELAAPHFSRQDDYGMRRKGGNKKKKASKKLFVRPTTGAAKLSSAPAPGSLNKARTVVPLEEKFELFQASVQNNPRILGALQKRRFTMVSILEKGTPGPPADVGRQLWTQSEEPPKMKRSMSMMVAARPGPVRVWDRNRVAPLGDGGANAPVKAVAATAAASTPVKSSSAMKKRDEDQFKLSDEDKAALKIQSLVRKRADASASPSLDGEPSSLALAALSPPPSLAAANAKANTMCSAVALSWEDVTLRFVRYVTDHFWSAGYDTDTCTLIFETWNAHLIKARTWALDEDGRKLLIAEMPKAATIKLCGPFELSEYELSSFHFKQSELNRMGVTKLLALVISSLSHNLTEGALPDTAIELFNELLNGGNEDVQDTLYHYLVNVDTEGQLVEHMAKRLEKAFEGLAEAKKNGRLGSDDDEKAADIADDCEHAITTARFLQLLCEGHHPEFQNYLRCQPMYGGDVDLVKAVCNILVFMCESTFVVSKFTYIELDLVAQLLNTLIDCMLGPCAGNQELIAKSDVIAALNLVIHAVNVRDEELAKQNPRYMGIRGLSCLLLAACLEGREDHATHDRLEQRLETHMLERYRADLEVDIWAILSEAKEMERLPSPNEVERIKVMQQSLVAVSTVLTELEKRGAKMLGTHENLGAGAESGGVGVPASSSAPPGSDGTGGAPVRLGAEEVREMRNQMAIAVEELKHSTKEPLVGLVEIAWRGKVERTVFPLPFEIKYLSEATKLAFLDEVDLSTSEKRMKSLLKKTDRFVREMEIIYREAEQSKVYRIVHKHLPMVKLANYGLVFALNLNLLLSPASLGAPAIALVEHLDGSHVLSVRERLSLFFTMVMGVMCTLGYGVIIANLAITELPLLIQELDEGIREDTEEAVAAMNEQLEAAATHSNARVVPVSATTVRTNGTRSQLLADEGGPPVKRNYKAWLPLTFGLLVTVLFSMLHAFNLDPNYGLYAVVILLAAVPLTFSGFRDYMGTRPKNQRERLYAIAYDCIVRRSFLRNHVILTICCFLGYFVNVEWFTLELLDVVIISPVIADIIKSVTTPGTALVLVLYLFCCTVLIFASFGITHFHEALQAPTWDYDFETSGRQECSSALSCFYLIFYHGLNEGGNLKNNLLSANPGNSYFPRVVFDSIFFVWVGIVLMNIITGLMVDTFSSIREEKQSREDILKNDCFVCGTLRNTYEDYALSSSAPSYDTHLAEDHHLWTYVYYIAYLKKKDPTEDSGIESYVRSQLEHYSLEWIPTRTSFVLEAEGKTGGIPNHSGDLFSSSSGTRPSTPGEQLADNETAMKKMDQIIFELRAQKESE